MNIFGLLAATTNVLSNVPYIYSVWHDPKIRPSFSTWTIWGSLDALRWYFMYQAGEFSYQMLGSCIGIALILAVGVWKKKLIPWSLADVCVALGVGLTMLAAYHFGGTPSWMLLASLVALTAGALPMYWKTIVQPYSEPVIPWIMVWLACLFQMLSTQHTTFEAIGVSAWIMSLTTILIITILVRRRFVEKA